MYQLRKHQRKIANIADDIVSGAFQKRDVVLDCTPGGGKTGAAGIMATKLLDAGIIDRVLWLVPRISLADQVVDAFAKDFGNAARRVLTVVKGQDQLFPNHLPPEQMVGHVTTYQTVVKNGNWERFRDAMRTKRSLLIADEIQFLNDEDAHHGGKGWNQKVRHVHKAADLRLLMSGTLWRTDDRRIPFLQYERRSDGKLYPQCDVEYTLRDAVSEEAVLPTEWHTLSGVVEYSYNGITQAHNLTDDGDDEESRKVRTFLGSNKAVHGLLDLMVEHWRNWCKQQYPSRMLVMASDQDAAKKWCHYLKEKHNIPCVLATHAEERAGRKLKQFRLRCAGQCLVTVAMAYVGFDCPDLTHLAYLSPARAPAWLAQSFARVSRCDNNAPVARSSQSAFVFAPDDERMRVYCSWLRNQTDMGIADRRREAKQKCDDNDASAVTMPDDFDPISATLTGRAVETLTERLPPDMAARLDAFAATCPAAQALSHAKLFEILTKAGLDIRAIPVPEVPHVV